MKQEIKSETIEFLSRLTSFTQETIRQHLKNQRYSELKIPKGNGRFRTLHIPEQSLKSFQKVLLERVLYKIPVHPVAHCAVPGHSVKTHVTPHFESQSFFRLDFKDAFPTVSRKMVIYRLRSLMYEEVELFKNVDCHDLVVLISRLTTYKNALPQGAPTSPYLLNLICYELDNRILEIVYKYDLVYTRYADDLWISSRNPKIPKEPRCSIIEAVKDYGFKINRDKIKYKTGKAVVPKIAGITIVDEKLKIPRESIEQYRVRIHRAANNPKIPVDEIFGIISWVTMIEGKKIPNRLQKPFKKFIQNRCPEKENRFTHIL